MALGGLDDLPPTLMSRSVVVRMRRRAPHEEIESFRHRLHSAEGHALRDELARWATTIPAGAWPEMPDEIQDRDADLWEALLIVADAAGGDWPKRARCAGVTTVTASKAAVPSMGVRLLADLRTVFENRGNLDYLSTEDVLSDLVAIEEGPWADLRGKPLSSISLSTRLRRYEVRPRTVRTGARTSKGYARADLIDPWTRYVTAVTGPEKDTEGQPADGAVTPVTTVTAIDDPGDPQ